jgi:hypothetical protein
VYNAAGVQQEPSQRLYDWVDRYTTLRVSSNLFCAWCDARGYAIHDAYDVLA